MLDADASERLLCLDLLTDGEDPAAGHHGAKEKAGLLRPAFSFAVRVAHTARERQCLRAERPWRICDERF